MKQVCQQTVGYSGADMANLCREAALGPIRSINFADIHHISVDQVSLSCWYVDSNLLLQNLAVCVCVIVHL